MCRYQPPYCHTPFLSCYTLEFGAATPHRRVLTYSSLQLSSLERRWCSRIGRWYANSRYVRSRIQDFSLFCSRLRPRRCVGGPKESGSLSIDEASFCLFLELGGRPFGFTTASSQTRNGPSCTGVWILEEGWAK